MKARRSPVASAPLLGAALAATLVLIAVLASALAAHVGIDVIGDFALPHDDYDGIAHSSRLGVVTAALTLVLAAMLGVLWSALDGAGRRESGQAPLRIVRHRALFCIAVAALSLLAVAGMEWLDATISGVALDGIAGAFGGSLWLGLAVTLPLAGLAAAAALRVARFIEQARVVLVRAIEALTVRLGRALPRLRRAPANERAPFVHLLAVYHGRAHKRGPPVTA
jgi:hypothetical protein